ncbi:hypothetical protein CURTO8I2_320059 [Curtobacterium sp. 8I-2]|nr:hypothetical protein CURTO8I2_320059 [Curtobacterium sp. 8I-2]
MHHGEGACNSHSLLGASTHPGALPQKHADRPLLSRAKGPKGMYPGTRLSCTTLLRCAGAAVS